MEQKDKQIKKWHQIFKKSTDLDSWGQLVEATTEYSKLAKQIRSSVALSDWDEDTKKTLLKIASCAECRGKLLHSVTSQEELSLADVRRLDKVFQNSSTSLMQKIPSDLSSQIDTVRLRNAISTPSPEPVLVDESEEAITFTSQINSLLPKLPLRPGIRLVTVNIVKIGLKDANEYIDPFFVVSCKDKEEMDMLRNDMTTLCKESQLSSQTFWSESLENCLKYETRMEELKVFSLIEDKTGIDQCRSQQTPYPSSRDNTYLHFNVRVELQMSIEEMHSGTAVFFDMRHYKAKRRSTITKCYAFMEVDELKPGPCVIELYKKPIDYRRKKLALLTSKPLYLHLALTITSE